MQDGWVFVSILATVHHSCCFSLRSLNLIVSASASPGEAPPGSRQRAEDGGEGQSRKERVEGEVEQSFHPIIAQAF